MSAFGEALTRLMAEKGMQAQEAAALVPCNKSHISKIRQGKARASRHVAERLDDILGTGGELLLTLAGPEDASAATPLPLREITEHAAEFGRWAETTNIGQGTLELLDDEITRISGEYAVAAPGPLVMRAAGVSRRLYGLLQQHQRLRQQRDLHVIAAKTSAFLACALGDLGEQAAAAAHARTAVTLAEESGHPAAIAVALSAMSRIAFWDGHHKRAADLAMRGYEISFPDSTRMLLACQQADASEPTAARVAISLAIRAYGEIAKADFLPGMFTCGLTRLACYTMTLRLREGDNGAVLAAAEDAAQASRDGEQPNFGTWAQLQISAGLAYLRMMEPEGAAECLAPVLALPAECHLATFTGKLAFAATLAASAPYRGSAAARDLAGKVRAYLGDDSPGRMPYPLVLGPSAQPRRPA
jgi:plasmid maintenance system antidote protein VapI